MPKSIDYDKICLRFSERREENILTRLNQREVEIIPIKLLMRFNEGRLKYDF